MSGPRLVVRPRSGPQAGEGRRNRLAGSELRRQINDFLAPKTDGTRRIAMAPWSRGHTQLLAHLLIACCGHVPVTDGLAADFLSSTPSRRLVAAIAGACWFSHTAASVHVYWYSGAGCRLHMWSLVCSQHLGRNRIAAHAPTSSLVVVGHGAQARLQH